MIWLISMGWPTRKMGIQTVNVRVSLKIYTIRSYIFWTLKKHIGPAWGLSHCDFSSSFLVRNMLSHPGDWQCGLEDNPSTQVLDETAESSGAITKIKRHSQQRGGAFFFWVSLSKIHSHCGFLPLKFNIFQLINVAQHGDSRLAMGLSETSVAISVIHPEKRMVDPQWLIPLWNPPFCHRISEMVQPRFRWKTKQTMAGIEI